MGIIRSLRWWLVPIALALVLLVLLGRCVHNFWSNFCLVQGFAIEHGLVPHADAEGELRLADPKFTPQWAADGTRIVFASSRRASGEYPYTRDPYGETPFAPSGQIYAMESDGSSLQLTTDGRGEAFYGISHSPSISPDSNRIAYSTLYNSTYGEERFAFGKYAIATATLDGSNKVTLTDGNVMDFAPTWSPKGSQIAFVRRHDRDGCDDFRRVGIYTVEVSSKDVRKIVDIPARSGEGTPKGWGAAYKSGPVWSPNGQQLAYVLDETEHVAEEGEPGYFDNYYYRRHTALYKVNDDGSELNRLLTFSDRGYLATSDQTYITPDEDLKRVGLFSSQPARSIVGPPSWSPDSRKIAFLGISDGVVHLYSIGSDGSNLIEVAAIDASDEDEYGQSQSSANVFWSIDGEQIMFSWDRVLYSVNVDGTNIKSFRGGDYISPSPDGSRIAHFIDSHSGVVLFTTSADGSNVQALARRVEDLVLERVGSDLRASADVDSCSAGVVVPDPETHSMLVRDCESLARILDRTATVGLNWNADRPIGEWEGVTLEVPYLQEGGSYLEEPLRVRGLSLVGRGLPGPFPLEVTELTGLWSLEFSGNDLNGPIPSELGTRTNLRSLIINESGITGQIPPELGLLADLRELSISGRLTGPIPPELGKLTKLETLSLSSHQYGQLSGNIPPELGNLEALETLSLAWNNLSGPIPTELGNLAELAEMDLKGNDLTGLIPPELGNLTKLAVLDLQANELGGSIPPELGNLASLEYLDLSNNQLEGIIPSELSQLTKLRKLMLRYYGSGSNRDLSGCISRRLYDRLEFFGSTSAVAICDQ